MAEKYSLHPPAAPASEAAPNQVRASPRSASASAAPFTAKHRHERLLVEHLHSELGRLAQLRSRLGAGHDEIGLAADRRKSRGRRPRRIFCSASSRVIVSSVPVSTKLLSRSAPRPCARRRRAARRSRCFISRSTASRLRGSSKYSRILRATSSPISRTARRSSSLARHQRVDRVEAQRELRAPYARRRGGFRAR